jgi:AcrR family transcriptional regulator
MTQMATREKLLEGTLNCVRERGVAGTTSRDIAAAAGTNLQAITYHFGSKDDLVAAALLRAITDRLEPALEILRRDMEPGERMAAAVQALQVAFEATRPDLAVYLEALLHAGRSATLQAALCDLLAELRGFLTEQIAELKADGYVPEWVDPPAMALLLLSIADGIALHSVLEPDVMDPGAVMSQAVQLLLSARA